MSFVMREEAFENLKLAKPFIKLPEDERVAILNGLFNHLKMGDLWMDREEFLISLNGAMKADNIKLAAPIKKAILSAFGERNEDAEICRDSKGNIEAELSCAIMS